MELSSAQLFGVILAGLVLFLTFIIVGYNLFHKSIDPEKKIDNYSDIY